MSTRHFHDVSTSASTFVQRCPVFVRSRPTQHNQPAEGLTALVAKSVCSSAFAFFGRQQISSIVHQTMYRAYGDTRPCRDFSVIQLLLTPKSYRLNLRLFTVTGHNSLLFGLAHSLLPTNKASAKVILEDFFIINCFYFNNL